MARRTREIWLNLIGQFERGEKTLEEFAKEREIPVGTLKNWTYRIRREKEEEGAAVLPVRVVAQARSCAYPHYGARQSLVGRRAHSRRVAQARYLHCHQHDSGIPRPFSLDAERTELVDVSSQPSDGDLVV
jgi:hypothetical protein